jgi:hypothetical protein
MKTLQTGLISRSTRILAGAVASVVVLLATSFGSVAHAEYDLKGYSPAQCRTFGPYSSTGVYYFHDRVQNSSASDYAMVICPALMDSESGAPMFNANVYFRKATASPALYCYNFSVNLASSSYRWYYNADSTSVGVAALYNGSIPSFRYGSNSVVCGLPPRSELLNYYAYET